MRRLPASRHIVSLVAVLRVDNPDRLCLVMEHCLGSVHDLQSAGVPCLMDESDEEKYCGNEAVILERPDEGSDQPPDASSSPRTNHNSPSTRGRSNPAHTHRTGKHRFRLKCPIIETDLKRETTRCTEAFMNRKVSNVEASSHRKGSVLHSVHNQQQQQQQFRRLSEAQAHAYFLQLVDGLHFLHSHGVIHRDIKPANLLLTPAPGCGLSPLYSVADVMDAADSGWLDGNGGPSGFVGRSLRDLLNASRGWLIKLTDFGVSASLSTFCPNDLVSSGQTTPAVQPPEVAKGVQSVFIGTKLDVYSAGVTLYFMLTGRVPFSCGNVLQIFEAIAQGDYTIPGHVSSNAARLIRRMMTKDPNKRITLKEISQHPWVLGDPPAPLTLSEVRTKLRTQLENSMLTTGSPTSMRGMITWLDPLVYLRRPTREYPLPHIDDTGARIFTASELEEEEEENETGSDSPQEIAPFSVLQRLQFYDALGEHTEEEEGNKPNQITSPILLPYTAGSHYIDAHLARLELSPGQSGDAICAEKCQPHCMSELKIRHSSGGAECLRPPNDLQSSSVQNSGGFRQRGVTISLPARADPGQTNRTSQYPPSGSSGLVSEPPACPADLPVSSVACFTPQPLLAICFGGTVGAVSCTDHLPNVMIERSPPSGSGSHSGFQLGSKLIQLSVDSFSQGKHSGDLSPCASGSHLTPDEQFVSDAPSATNTISRVDTWANCERMGGSVNSTGRRTVSGRFTRWFSRSLSSIQRRLYRLRDRARKRHGPDTEDDLDSHPPDSLDVSNSHTPDHRSMHDSVISDAISERQSSKTGKHGKRLLFRRKSVRSSEDGFT
ncbi:Serine:threonine protein kinase 11 [Fasciola hepatica]|uniref:non-specific serine/threonine protein kinase n=1 Tax=Fasciola hepatica TaxID=6192 RepID=A0A4E0S2D2_FASHE|nr:Serine:threonine protein kinase 11 [Fasciola hepatica]